MRDPETVARLHSDPAWAGAYRAALGRCADAGLPRDHATLTFAEIAADLATFEAAQAQARATAARAADAAPAAAPQPGPQAEAPQPAPAPSARDRWRAVLASQALLNDPAQPGPAPAAP